MKLIMKGARRDIKDANGRFPIDLIMNSSSEEILSDSIRQNLLNHLVRIVIKILGSFCKMLFFYNNEAAS